jgi:hypothetical protein
VKVFRRRPSQTFPHACGRRLKTSKGRNREKGHVLGRAHALSYGDLGAGGPQLTQVLAM